MSDAPVPKPVTVHWSVVNAVARQMRTLRIRTKQAIAGNSKLLIIYGPPGIAKSETISDELRRYAENVRADWLSAKIKPERRTVHDEDGNPAFRPPFEIIKGRISHPQFHCQMYHASGRGEVLFVDDVQSLSDPNIQEVIQAASDATHQGLVKYNFNANLPDDRVPKTYNMRGSIIIVTNFNKGDPESLKALKQLFSEPVRDRAVELTFPFERRALREYVGNLAFTVPVPEKPTGLYAYMIRPTPEERPDLPDTMVGPGFKGTAQEARKMLLEVKNLFEAEIDRVENISFRFLRKVVADRVLNPDIWRELTENDHLKPRPPQQHNMDKGDTHAFL